MIVFCHDFGFIDHRIGERAFLIRYSSYYAVVEVRNIYMSSSGFISTTPIPMLGVFVEILFQYHSDCYASGIVASNYTSS